MTSVNATDVVNEALHNKLVHAIAEIADQAGDDDDLQASIYFSLKFIVATIEKKAGIEPVEVILE